MSRFRNYAEYDLDRRMGPVVEEMERERREEIALLRDAEYHTQTNSGTYGAQEAFRKVGTGDPHFADRDVYETVGGRVRSTGPAADRAPGYTRYLDAGQLKAARELLTRLEAE